MNFEDKLKHMVKGDDIPLPADYDEMLQTVYKDLVSQCGEEQPVPKRRAFRFTRFLAIAAVISLMAASMAVGALAFGRETVVEVPVEVKVPVEIEVPVEVEVEVPVEPETIALEELGLTLILPDSWKEKYVVVYHGDTSCTVYVRSIYEDPAAQLEIDGKIHHMGRLFTVNKSTMENGPDVPNRFLFATADCAYYITYASDVQYTAEHAEEYLAMDSQCRDIQVVINGIMEAAAAASSGGL